MSTKSYLFRIHKGETPTPQDNGWTKSAYLGVGDGSQGISSIPDLMDKVPASGKVGTAIPTPFARVYLFKTAVELVQSNPGAMSGIYDKLVSDCLDIIQLLFEKGGDTSKFEFVRWQFEPQVRKLRESNRRIQLSSPNYNALGLLADSFEMAMGPGNDFKGDITLIKYDGMLLGGTSPYTLIFTSPNLRAELAKKRAAGEYDFSSNKKVPFLGGKPTPLSRRPVEFQAYLKTLVSRLDISKTAQGSAFHAMSQYILRQTEGVAKYDTEVFEEVCPGIIDKTNTPLTISGLGLTFSYNQLATVPTESHFMMKPTVNNYKRFIKSVPLVLPCDHQKLGWTFIDDEWDIHTQIPDWSIKSYGEIKDRVLPKNGSTNGEKTSQKYPWVTNADFLEDTLLDLTYMVNRDKFIFPDIENARFLLPIKKEYFLFFTPEDLERNLKMIPTFQIRERDGEVIDYVTQKVQVELTIPLNSNKGSLTLTRTYSLGENEKYSIRQVSPNLVMGVFPFYRLEEKNGLRNEYSVYLYNSPDKAKTADLRFYNSRGEKSVMTPVTAEVAQRTNIGAGVSKVYNLRTLTDTNIFDLIEVRIPNDSEGQYSGLVIPKWTYISADDLSNDQFKVIFSIDFGTSNTHTAYWDPRSNQVRPLSIGLEDQQMVLLNKPYVKDRVHDFRKDTSFGRARYASGFLREFVPSVIGAGLPVEYPVKTATLESVNFGNGKNLFGNINIGYDIENETVDLTKESAFSYKTDLKWALQKDRGDSRARQRVEAFCEQTLWMLKNILVLHRYYYKNIKIIYFYPESMMPDDKNMFEEAWNSEAERIFSKCGFSLEGNSCVSELESVAPYYSLLKRDSDLFAYNSVNIDIGGGTTDIMIMDKLYDRDGRKTAAYEASVQFAGNDLWDVTFPSGSKNGFVEYMKAIIEQDSAVFSPEVYTAYKNFSQKDKPAEMTSFLFKYKDFNFGQRIANKPKLRYILFLHYASVIWYLSDMIKYVKTHQNPDFVMPNTLTFTGKGSEYIKIISPKEDDISRLTFALFLAFGFTREEFKNGFHITYPDNPKGLTAEGGIYKLIADPAIKIDFVRKDDFMIGRENFGRSKTEYENLCALILGFRNDETKEYPVDRVRDYKPDVMASFEQFLSALFNGKELNGLLKSLNMSMVEEDRMRILELARRSYDMQAERMVKEHSAGDKVETSLFFLAMKNLLIDLSLYYYDK